MDEQTTAEQATAELTAKSREIALRELMRWFYTLEPDTEREELQGLIDELIPGAFTISPQRG